MILISSILPSSKTWNSISHEVILPLILLWPSFKRQIEILETSPPHSPLGIFETSSHIPRNNIPCTHIFCGPKMARPPARNHERAWKNSIPAVSIYASNVASTAHKDLSHLTCFNSDRKGHYATKCPKPRKKRGYSQTSSATKFHASGTLPSSKKNLCWFYLIQKVRLMPYTLPLLRN